MAPVWSLLKTMNAQFLIPSHPHVWTPLIVFECPWRPSTAFKLRMLLISSNARFFRPFPWSHTCECGDNVPTSSTAFRIVQPPWIVGNLGGHRQFEHYWNLSMLDCWYHPIPHVWMPSIAFECPWPPWTAFERVRRHQWERYINLGLLTVGLFVYTVKYVGAFWDRIILYRNILCSIVPYPSFPPTSH